MRISMMMNKHTQPILNLPSTRIDVNLFNNLQLPKEKVVVVMGATGTGKSRLSIDLASHFPSEIINSDKMQVYDGLDIVTNKITKEEQLGIPHHLLGIANPSFDFSATKFSHLATLATKSIISRGRLPIIVGGSNSFIEALVDNDDLNFTSRHEFCFLWVDVSMHVLHSFLSARVDTMIARGMIDEARRFFDPYADYSRGIRRAIGVSEFDHYFRTENFMKEEIRAKLLREAIRRIKDNTSELARRQLGKIHRLRNIKGWTIHRLDASEAFRLNGNEADEAWNKFVTAPSTMIVSQFLHNVTVHVPPAANASIRVPFLRTAIAAATH